MAERTRHLLFGLLFLAITFPFFVQWVVPPRVGPEAQRLYSFIERQIPKNKLVILSLEYEAGTIGENLPQTRALIAHLMRRGIRFAIMGFDPVGPQYGRNIALELGRKYGRREGIDWVDWGFRPGAGMSITLSSLIRDVPGTMKTDTHGTPLSKVPAMKGIKTAQDIGLVVDITPSNTYGAWMAFFTSAAKVPFAVAPTAVMAADIFPFLNSGQVVGMLKGLAGAAQYEILLGDSGLGVKSMTSISMTHLLIVVLILIGNALEIKTRRRGQR